MSSAWQLAIGTNTPTIVSAAGGEIVVSDPSLLDVGGGAAFDMLQTDGAGHLSWHQPPGAAGGIADAPNDVTTYGRKSAAWVSVLPIVGGTLTGLLTLSGPPTASLHAATKAYVDAHTLPVSVDGVSITGDGVSTPLSVNAIDAGIY